MHQIRSQIKYIIVLYMNDNQCSCCIRSENVLHDPLLCPARFSSGKINGKGSWHSKLFWLVLRHEVPRSLAADWSKHLSIFTQSGDAFRTNTTLAGFLVIRAFFSEPGPVPVLQHRADTEQRRSSCSRTAAVFSGHDNITHRHHACDKARWAGFCCCGSGLS